MRVSTRHRFALLGATMAILLAIKVGIAAAGAMSNGDIQSPAPTSVASPSGAVPSLSKDVQVGLESSGITAEPAPDKTSPTVGPDEAINLARGEIPLAADAPAYAALVSLTTNQFGLGDEETGAVAHAYDRRLAWAVVFDGVSVPFLGSYGVPGPEYVKGGLVVFVDASTGDFLLGVTV